MSKMFSEVLKAFYLLYPVLLVLGQSNFPKSEYLLNGKFKLEWSTNDTSIVFRVSAETGGWFGLGISKDGSMVGSDIVIGWIDPSNAAFISDCYSASRSRPTRDQASQDWTHLDGKREEGKRLVFTMSRRFTTSDTEDLPIVKAGDTNIIFAIGSQVPTTLKDVSYHGAADRGFKAIDLLDGSYVKPTVPVPDPATVTVPVPDTTLPPGSVPSTPTLSREKQLDPNYKLQWHYEAPTHGMDKGRITFRVTVKTSGYVGFGLSPNGGMKDADIVIGWVDGSSQNLHLRDMHGVGNMAPVEDMKQNWFIQSGSEVNGITTLTFYRDLDTCDKDDLKIGEGAMRVIFAYNDVDPDRNNFVYHGSNRGAVTVYLSDVPEAKVPLPTGYKTLDVHVPNITLPAQRTYYYCHLVKIDVTGGKQHITHVRQLVTPGNEKNVHHMIIYECPIGLFNDTHVDLGGECDADHLRARNIQTSHCLGLFAGFAIGDTDLVYPPETGFPIGDGKTAKYYLIEVHYDNPNLKSDIVDSTGIRLYYTPNLREHDAGILMVGASTRKFNMVIPPHQERFNYSGFCSKQCLQSAFKYSGVDEINVFAAMGHAHLAGSGVTMTLVRQGIEQPWIINDDTYDFDYQQWRWLRNKVKVKPGDELMTSCSYRTKSRSQVTYAGSGTNEEMCLGILVYYPKIALGICVSVMTEYDFAKIAADVWGNPLSANWSDVKDVSYKTSAFYDTQAKWDPYYIRKFQNRVYNHKAYPVCPNPETRNMSSSGPINIQINHKYSPARNNLCFNNPPASAASIVNRSILLSIGCILMASVNLWK